VKHQKYRRVSLVSGLIISTAMLALPLTFPSAQAQDKPGTTDIAPGTILPVRLNETLSSAKSQPGQIITARVMQDVPLANGGKIRAGSRVTGHVVAVSSQAGGNRDNLSLQFDKVVSEGRTIPVRTNLRAAAGFMTIMEAETPSDGPVSLPIANTQVGGDVAYTAGGEVTTANGERVGKSVHDGVLDQVRAGSRQGRDCEGATNNNTNPQALWIFSSDACGTYGLSDIRIAHAGKTTPVGVIILISEKGQLKLPSGAGMLLRVQE
jgi:hypothetical protein